MTLVLIEWVSDVNECENGEHNCHKNAECSDNKGSFTCECAQGFEGSGTDCTSMYSRIYNSRSNSRTEQS